LIKVSDPKSFSISIMFQVSPQSSRYMVVPQPSMSVLRIESAKPGKDDAKYECVAENGVGDAVTASATLSIYPGMCWHTNSLTSAPLGGMRLFQCDFPMSFCSLDVSIVVGDRPCSLSLSLISTQIASLSSRP
jgi:hypothetical protein